MPAKSRVVLDTNVIVSGFINPTGPPGRILKALQAKRFQLITSAAINEEVLEVMNRPKLRDKYGLKEFLFDVALILWEFAEVVTDPPPISVVKDPDDNKFLAAALEGKADYLVTGDAKDLLIIQEWKGIKIITPSQFITIIT